MDKRRKIAQAHRPKGVLALGWACLEAAITGRAEHRPTSVDYADHIVRRISFAAGGDFGWRISAIVTPRPAPTAWKIVVVTGAPSWAEYWAPVAAALPPDREMIVVDRPGYGASEPHDCVPDIREQARALLPLLEAAPGQRILLVGQSYGAAIATLMAQARPRDVASVVLLSSYLGEPGPTARWLVRLGSRLLAFIPRDLRHAVMEVSGQGPQLALMRRALARLRLPVQMIHGDQDDFAPLATARAFTARLRTRRPIRFEIATGADHFLNDGPAERLISLLETCLASATPAARRWFGWEGFRIA